MTMNLRRSACHCGPGTVPSRPPRCCTQAMPAPRPAGRQLTGRCASCCRARRQPASSGWQAARTCPRACLRSEGSEPFADGGDVEGGLVADGELLVAGGDGAVALEPVDTALDGVALLVLLLVEGGRPAS